MKISQPDTLSLSITHFQVCSSVSGIEEGPLQNALKLLTVDVLQQGVEVQLSSVEEQMGQDWKKEMQPCPPEILVSQFSRLMPMYQTSNPASGT